MCCDLEPTDPLEGCIPLSFPFAVQKMHGNDQHWSTLPALACGQRLKVFRVHASSAGCRCFTVQRLFGSRAVAHRTPLVVLLDLILSSIALEGGKFRLLLVSEAFVIVFFGYRLVFSKFLFIPSSVVSAPLFPAILLRICMDCLLASGSQNFWKPLFFFWRLPTLTISD